ncbi:unnamed protein product, partial [Sphagnum compactum]
LFIDESKLTPEATKHLQINILPNHKNSGLEIELRPYKMIKAFLKWLISEQPGKIWISNKSSYALVSLVPESRRVDSLSPVLLKKSVKNPIEIEGMKRSHVSSKLLYSIRIDYHFNNVFDNKIKNAVALCEFFAWLEEEIPKGDVDELSAASKLEEFR